ncbi:proline--tRNA ligase [Dissulfurispira thermophila]|uniref:Proline--tRNA ligase n=2 Tax=root TaxID=1 RepID=A0A7G1H101_9BACT|nr:proline--tRNA ligase [Dissulfurispira thermophila]BCB96268.1 proline--tRNA ligase [Dissulfurispira thermophila]
MRFSKMFIPTMREVPSEAEAISHKLMLRAGYVRQLASGLYIFLPLGWRVLNKINNILKEEMEAIGAQEISMPILHPAEIWQKTGRWYEIKDEMFRLKDRTDRDMCLGMTHEEIMTWLASKEIRSYRQLPQIWYQIQTKLRDEARPKSGVLRTREFIMKDSYSFDADEEGLEKSYKLHADAYYKIFNRCGLKFYQVESDPGMMGGATAHEFMAPSLAGEDEIIICNSCGYTANIEVAYSISSNIKDSEWEYEEVYTPQKRTVKEVSEFLNINPAYFIKSLLFMTNKGPVLVLIRGDQDLHEKKLTKIIGQFRTATKEEITSILGVEAGFIGPIGHNIRMIADSCLKNGTYITGANKIDYHIKGVKPDLHFKTEWHDLHIVKTGDLCPKCNTPIIIEKAIEIGNIFKLGTKYSVSLNAVFLDKNGQEKPVIMGSYGIGPARIAAAAIEQNHDADGIIWPKSIAPFDIEIIPININDNKTLDVVKMLYQGFIENDIDVLIDDRDERPGIKFKDADLIGIPVHIIIGEKNLKNNQIEIKDRRTKEIKRVSIENAISETIAFFQKIY